MSGFILLSDDILHLVGSFLREIVLKESRAFHEKNNRERRKEYGENFQWYSNPFVTFSQPTELMKKHCHFLEEIHLYSFLMNMKLRGHLDYDEYIQNDRKHWEYMNGSVKPLPLPGKSKETLFHIIKNKSTAWFRFRYQENDSGEYISHESHMKYSQDRISNGNVIIGIVSDGYPYTYEYHYISVSPYKNSESVSSAENILCINDQFLYHDGEVYGHTSDSYEEVVRPHTRYRVIRKN